MLRGSPDGRFLENTTIRALPTQPGDYVQAKLFFGGYFGNTLNDRIPSRIFFDMHLGGPASRIGQIDPPACFFWLDLHQMTLPPKPPCPTFWLPMPIGSQGIVASWRKKSTAFVATHMSSKKAPAATASIKSEPKC